MLQIDLSNVWCNLSLPELLAVEKRVSDAHAAVEAAAFQMLPRESADDELRRIWSLAKDIKDMSDVVIVVGGGCDSLGAQGIVELLQGEERSHLPRRGKSAVFFGGRSLSQRSFEALGRTLEGRDFSVILAEGEPEEAEAQIVFRAFRWMLERRYGASGAQNRIFALCREGSPLSQAAESAGWQCLKLQDTYPDGFGVFSARGLLALCVAGVDVEKLLHGAWEAKQALELRSYENPVWLYAAVRACLGEKGQRVELLRCNEPDFQTLGRWWQSLMLDTGSVLFPAPNIPMAGFPAAEQWLAATPGAGFVTNLSFEPGAGFPVVPDIFDGDGLNFLAGRKTGQLGLALGEASAELLSEKSVSIVSLECGEVNEENIGAMVYFMQLACAVSQGIVGKCCEKTKLTGEYTEKMFASLGKTTDEN